MAQPKPEQDDLHSPPPAPGLLPAWFGLGLGTLAVALICVFSLQMLFASRLPTPAKSTPVMKTRVTDTPPPEVDFSGEGILIVEYGGQTDPETGDLSVSDSEPDESSTDTVLELESPEPSPSLQPSATPANQLQPPQVHKPLSNLSDQRQQVAPPPLPPRSGQTTLSPPALKPAPENKSEPTKGFTVLAGSYASREAAQTDLQKLAESGYNASLFEEGQRFRLKLNTAFANQEEAMMLADEIALKGYEVMVKSF